MKIHKYIVFGLIFFFLMGCEKESKHYNSPGDGDDTVEDSTATQPVNETAIAFPGAEGGGVNASGGRGGKVYKVTSLDDTNEEGTLRYAINKNEPRIIVFDVSGTINLKSAINIAYGNLTLAGQTAPGDGITIANFPLSISSDNVIIRCLRVRMGDASVFNAGIADGADAMGGRQKKNIIIDHCSISWSTDECCSFYDNENFTLQWSIISESLRLSNHSKGPHGYGGIWGGVNASFHHNLMAHHDSRTPRYGPGVMHMGTDRVDVRNNVFYNWSGNGCYGGEAMKMNIVNNYYKPGPATQSKVSTRVIQIDVSAGGGDFDKIIGIWGRYYITGNYFPESSSVTANNWMGVNIYQKDGLPVGSEALLKLTSEVETYPIAMHTAEVAYDKVLALAGSSKARDAVDKRIINETLTGTATFKGLNAHNGYGTNYPGSDVNWKSIDYPKSGIIDSQNDLNPLTTAGDWSAWPNIASTLPLPDTDEDGMPDEWEKAQKLDPLKYNANGRNLSTGYDNIEIYINGLMGSIVELQK